MRATEADEEDGELPAYTVRVSARSRHVRLCVTPTDGLVVVVPSGYPEAEIPGLLRKKKRWLIRALEANAQQQERMANSRARPDQINLRALDQLWRIRWILEGSDIERRLLVSETEASLHGGTLVIRGPVDDPEAWPRALRDWLRQQAREYLIPWLFAEASSMGVRVENVTIRCQKTRWGSCSARGTISLNAQLLFLPRELVSYVLCHELCHLTYPNHSPSFWKLVETCEPDVYHHRRALRRAADHVPVWIRTPRVRRSAGHGHD